MAKAVSAILILKARSTSSKPLESSVRGMWSEGERGAAEARVRYGRKMRSGILDGDGMVGKKWERRVGG